MREIRQGACGAIRPINRAPTIGGVARPGAWRLTGPCGRPALPGEWRPKASRRLLLMREIRQGACGAIRPINRAPTIGGVARPGAWRLTGPCGRPALPGEWRPKASRRLLLMREIRQGACGAIRPINRAPTIGGVARPGAWRLTGPCGRPALPGEWGPTWFCGSQAPPGEWRPKASRRLLLMREIRQGACGAIRPINRAPTIGGVAPPGEWGPTWFCGSQAPPGEWGPTWFCGSQAPPGEWRLTGPCGSQAPPGEWRLTGPCRRPALPGEWRRRRLGGVASVGACRQEPFGLHSLGEPELPQGALRSPFARGTRAPTGCPATNRAGLPVAKPAPAVKGLAVRYNRRLYDHLPGSGARTPCK